MKEVEGKTFRMSTSDEEAMVGLNSTSDWFNCRVYVTPAANEAEQNNKLLPEAVTDTLVLELYFFNIIMAAGQKLYPRATVKKIVKAHSKRNVSKNVDVLVRFPDASP